MGFFSKKSKSIDITHPPLSPPCQCRNALEFQRSDSPSSHGSASSYSSSSYSSPSYPGSSASSERSSSESDAPPRLTCLSPPPVPRKQKSQQCFSKEDQMQIVDKIYWEAIDDAKVGPKSCWTREAGPRTGAALPGQRQPACPDPRPFGQDADSGAKSSAAALQRELDDLVPAAERLVVEASKPALAYIARASRLVKEARHMQTHMDCPDDLEPAIFEMEEKLLRVSGLVGLLVAARGKMEWPENRRYPGRWTHRDGSYGITASLVIDDTQTFPYGFNVKSEGPGLYVGCAREDVTCVVNGI